MEYVTYIFNWLMYSQQPSEPNLINALCEEHGLWEGSAAEYFSLRWVWLLAVSVSQTESVNTVIPCEKSWYLSTRTNRPSGYSQAISAVDLTRTYNSCPILKKNPYEIAAVCWSSWEVQSCFVKYTGRRQSKICTWLLGHDFTLWNSCKWSFFYSIICE